MPIDQTAKRQAVARKVMNNVDKLMMALYEAQDAVNEIASAGLVFDPMDFENSSDMKHITPDNLATASSNVTAALTEWETSSRDDVFNLIRP